MSVSTVHEKLRGADWTEKRFGRREHLAKQSQDLLKLIPRVCRVEDDLTDAVKSITKQASGGPLMRLELNWLDGMSQNTHMIGPAKGDRWSS